MCTNYLYFGPKRNHVCTYSKISEQRTREGSEIFDKKYAPRHWIDLEMWKNLDMQFVNWILAMVHMQIIE